MEVFHFLFYCLGFFPQIYTLLYLVLTLHHRTISKWNMSQPVISHKRIRSLTKHRLLCSVSIFCLQSETQKKCVINKATETQAKKISPFDVDCIYKSIPHHFSQVKLIPYNSILRCLKQHKHELSLQNYF